MSPGAWTALVAIIGGVLAAASGAYAAVQARKVNVTTVDIRVFNSLREDYLTSKAEIRELEREADRERRRRRDLEEQVHRISRALYAANIAIPENVAALLRPPSNGPEP